MINVVIDTNLWHAASSELFSDAMTVLHNIKQNDNFGICLDDEHKIMDEYNNQSCKEFFTRWVRDAFCNNPYRIHRCSSNLTQTIENKLTQLKFDPADLPFVGTAYNSDKVIITEDSDYGVGPNQKAQTPEKQAILNYLNSIGLTVYDYQQAVTTTK